MFLSSSRLYDFDSVKFDLSFLDIYIRKINKKLNTIEIVVLLVFRGVIIHFRILVLS